MTNRSDDRSALATAYEWATRIIVVSLEMVLPGLVGYWIDTHLNTVCLFLVIGLTVGSVVAMRHLIKLARESSEKR
ncbi:MAG TPA: AtpZ/AtpI family protein [Lacipirellulaceae bacterium]|nr:AtpZ/AtpI family protein [Lacipirellulaceae bacterium]